MSTSDKPSKIPGNYNAWDDGTEHSVRQFTQGRMNVEIMPEGYILLAKELATGYHPVLAEKLAGIPVTEYDEKLAVICIHCGVVLDGFYTIQERSILCATLSGRLELMRDFTKGAGNGGTEIIQGVH